VEVSADLWPVKIDSAFYPAAKFAYQGQAMGLRLVRALHDNAGVIEPFRQFSRHSTTGEIVSFSPVE
jgi:hypothetical protein